MRSNTTRLLVRNASYLGLGQVASTALGILLAAVIGRALEPAQLGNLYIATAISTFVYVIVDWGQGVYLVKELARGRADEPELIGSALLVRLPTILFSSIFALTIALARGYDSQIIALTFLTMAAMIPASLFVPFDCSFRAKDRMDVDAFANIVGKAVTLVATAIALRFGGGLTEVILMLGVGNVSILLAAVIAAQRLDIAVKAPVMKAFNELFRRGASIAAISLAIASQPFLEILLLSALAGPAIVGWYGAFRTIFGVVTSPALILLGASFPELSRASLSVLNLRRMIDATGRVLLIAAAFASSALYLFANDIVAIIYGHGRFEQTASILRTSAIFVPLLFFTFLLASVILALGRNKALVVLNVARIALYVALSWVFVGYWQQRYGNGAIALVIIAGLVELPAMIAYLMMLPKGALGSTTTLNVVRAHVVSFCTAAPLSMLQPLGLLYLVPLFALSFAVIALVTRLISPSDLRLAMEVVRNRVFISDAPKSASDG
ncbi:oligosaccharide flippase family protein [Bradyrhizobium erythrophlei]|uniref:Membrane protein involved in the export of O-antigen and teichoic acid n=1 Tax=Bradyrhizobium erythrophlei TaxID=1437360 RepID=A0A1M7SQH4_9BRAD|nr:oligosaccharide flippase family protein [Bradyrhizobium erythrophlei]SHN60664.1 Membrane protein involved in the export of O-antigen and teichoic acid [Bradyrhizobium erythrophlei]